MTRALRTVALLLGVLTIPLAVFASHSGSHANTFVWNNIVMTNGGTYSVPLATPAPTYVTGPEKTPDGEWVFQLFGNLYKVNGPIEREFVESFFDGPTFDDPDDPNDGDELFAWPAAGIYELDLQTFPPPQPFFIRLQQWLARIFFADVAYAQVIPAPDPIFLGTIRFTIEDADAVPAEPDPVIIIPGILGSEQHNGEWVIDPILHTYDDLIATLDANGYTREEDLFTFPYNWRKSNVETAVLLKEKIDEVKGICECDKVDLVAHSMGGLVARQYIQSDDYEDDVDQLIFLGTPHLGAPKAYSIWEAGEYTPSLLPIEDRLIERMLNHEATEQGYPDLFTYIRTKPIPSVGELLPVYDYIFDGNVLRSYPANYPRNVFLENLRAQIGNLLNSRVRISNIIGETGTDETIVGIQSTNPSEFLPKWQHGYPDGFSNSFGDHGLIRGQGDATVPIASAAFVSSNIQTIASKHTEIPADAQANIFRILTGNDPDTLVRNINLPNVKIFLLKIFSPADLLVIAPDGSKVGKDFDGQEVNEILNAFYTGFGADTEFITILNPLDGDYKVYTQGTGSGLYTVEANLITNATTTGASFTGNTASGITSELNLGVENGAIAPDALDIVVTYDSTLADLERLYGVGHAHFGIYKSLKAQLLAAKKAPPVVAKRLLQNMLKQLKGYRGKLITEQGYHILNTDIENLLRTL